MSKQTKYTVHMNEGECCLVVPITWANHIAASYKDMALAAENDGDAKLFVHFAEMVEAWIEETAVDFYD